MYHERGIYQSTVKKIINITLAVWGSTWPCCKSNEGNKMPFKEFPGPTKGQIMCKEICCCFHNFTSKTNFKIEWKGKKIPIQRTGELFEKHAGTWPGSKRKWRRILGLPNPMLANLWFILDYWNPNMWRGLFFVLFLTFLDPFKLQVISSGTFHRGNNKQSYHFYAFPIPRGWSLQRRSVFGIQSAFGFLMCQIPRCSSIRVYPMDPLLLVSPFLGCLLL